MTISSFDGIFFSFCPFAEVVLFLWSLHNAEDAGRGALLSRPRTSAGVFRFCPVPCLPVAATCWVALRLLTNTEPAASAANVLDEVASYATDEEEEEAE